MILCGIVLYNPDMQRLNQSILSVKKQVDKIILIDNNSNNFNIVNNNYIDDSRVFIIKNDANMGIAKALNQIFDYSRKNNYDWVLTLDQDSICSEGMVANMMKYSKLNKIGILCPLNLDKGGYCNDNSDLPFRDMNWCITSGALTNIRNTFDCFFDEKMFIDMVDYDFSLQVKEKGLRIIRVYNAILFHRLGDLQVKKIFGFNIEITNHSPLRRYYYTRNVYYVIKKHKLSKKTKKYWKRKIKILYLKILFFEKNKFKKIRMMHKGIIDVRRM